MKAMKTILIVMAAAGLAMAQAPAAGKPKAPASQTVSGSAAAPSAAPAQAKAPAKPAAAPAAKPAPKVAAKPAAKPAKKPVVTAVAKSSAAAATKPAAAKAATGKRDPFVNPVVRVAGGGGGGPVCSTGKRCLMISEMVLRGIVKTQGGMIAVVSNAANRAYFLKENDPVFNGMVVKITGDSVIFKESVVDNLGRESSREVVKRVSAPTV